MVVQVDDGSVPRRNSWSTQDVPPALLSSEVMLLLTPMMEGI